MYFNAQANQLIIQCLYPTVEIPRTLIENDLTDPVSVLSKTTTLKKDFL